MRVFRPGNEGATVSRKHPRQASRWSACERRSRAPTGRAFHELVPSPLPARGRPIRGTGRNCRRPSVGTGTHSFSTWSASWAGTWRTLSPKQRHSVPWAQQWQPSEAAVSVNGTGKCVPAAAVANSSSSSSGAPARRPVIASWAVERALNPGARPRAYRGADRSAAACARNKWPPSRTVLPRAENFCAPAHLSSRGAQEVPRRNVLSLSFLENNNHENRIEANARFGRFSELSTTF
ncbi:hypothetical protein HPB48_002182 [Haemaphysalis longicornis]|uniref:Uncharacterized protein n=1 Tax=Haemaphysalis longicornis TaxID=44386 RepID=A0A9J6FJV5_HAELO|nr:hypothetical protein HPB48_002182 [Haemaphysalis longicornis]